MFSNNECFDNGYLNNALLKIKKTMVFFYASLFLSLLAGCSEGDPTALYESLIVEFNDVQSISVSALNTVITTGDSLQLTVTGKNSQGGDIDLTEYVSWSVSDDNLAQVKSGGLLESFTSDGTVTVTASLSNFSATETITLSSAALETIDIKADTLTPDTLESDVCRPLSLKAFGNYEDFTVRDITDKVSWSTSTASAILNTSNGVSLSYYLSATASIKAELGAINSTENIIFNEGIVSMALTPATVTLETGSTETFQVLAVYGSETDINISKTVNYVSSDPSKADFNNNDEVLTGILQGSTTVTATCGLQIETALVSVEGNAIDRIEISSAGEKVLVTMTPESSVQLEATVYYTDGNSDPITTDASWSALHPDGNIVTISNVDPDKGTVTSSTTTGNDEIQIEYSGFTDTIAVQVSP